MTRHIESKHLIGKQLRRLSDQIDRDARRVYKQQGVPFEQRWTGFLHQLSINDAMTVKEISQALGITHASVSETRKSLSKAGLILSEQAKHDQRQKLLSLSPKGKKLVAKLSPIWRVLEDCSADLNEEAQDIVTQLDHLETALAKASLYERAMKKLN